LAQRRSLFGWKLRSRKGLISSFPIRAVDHEWEIVQNVSLNDFSRQKIDASVNELKEEKALVAELLG
jgi:malate dehydrogenase